VYRAKAREGALANYGLFVTFFPHLIAGPILHHGDMMPQFASADRSPSPGRFAAGWTIFVLGLAKKVICADSIAAYVQPVFAQAGVAGPLSMAEAWLGALSYTLQLYFDFSGYSDMAVGLGLLFNIVLPINFLSPYKAVNIIDFWRRWHITLSRYLRDYLYIPLGGNRHGSFRRYLNLLLTMALGGLWHGAGWTFVVWGCLHGGYLCLNHGWIAVSEKLSVIRAIPERISRLASIALTFLCVVVGWVIFRSADLPAAGRFLRCQFGLGGDLLPSAWLQGTAHMPAGGAALESPWLPLVWIAVLMAIVWAMPNVMESVTHLAPGLSGQYGNPVIASAPGPLRWRMDRLHAVILAVLFAISVVMMSQASEFLYFQF
jgi:alginate O-acetyltransferase complex protein AlgI